MELKDLFPEWYSVVEPGFTSERIARRLSAISKIAGSTTKKHLTDLVSLFYGVCANDDFIGEMRAALKDADDTYVSHDKAELAVVAGGALYFLLKKANSVASTAALFLLCAEYGGLRETARIDAVVVRARDYLFEEGSRVREEVLRFPNMTELLKGATKKLQAATKDKPAAEDVVDADTSLDIQSDTLGALKTYATGMSEALAVLEKRRLEESSVLYWLLGGSTLISEEPFEKVDRARLALLAANDLAVQTQHLPGPASCRSILRTVIGRGKGNAQQSSTEACVGKLAAGDGERLLRGTKALAPLFMPLSFALEKNRENGWASGWENAFTAQTRMSASTTRSLDEIAEQYYRELLLTRLLNEA